MKDFEDALLDIAWKSLDSENSRFKDIDTKAIGIITIVGILMTFLSKPAKLGCLSTTLFLLTAISFLITILICALVIRVRVLDILSTNYLIEDFKNEKPERQIRGLISTIAKAEGILRDRCNQKANELRHAVFALGISIVLLILYSLSIFL